MSAKFWWTAAAAATVAITPLVAAPMAAADDSNCAVDNTATVCQSDGSAAIVATPPQVGDGAQNGPYGPAGDTAPVGGNGL
ncbi:hypothetical protein MMAD_18790 [Mycolicibacterium madagascariense]|jgi:hypothetical protein|uniref:Uncharacterized protein n=1 Tax=Mycolicibacterium madagascariense TaxID=212765 RepID=A0A7I7XD90_9MYCO|nr:hypothetical protein [Mycolicibacterium madagascariense]MCV7015290.1 hypothetical protein [Mycolicibacterium madagascariense]BBZ27584.1 hypothetical protein MMAD_18790 [Mycolicibacterium madagascariense]